MKSLKFMVLVVASILVLGSAAGYAKPVSNSNNKHSHHRLKVRPVTPEMRKAAAERAKARREQNKENKPVSQPNTGENK
ncbi:MAG: hypothetical protein LHV68_06610 [Elusimicrobia bacterium]|nr:hypothetical protein [Candidatus Liberimonas magnetica]